MPLCNGTTVTPQRICKFIAKYLAMIEWMHTSNLKSEVVRAEPAVAHVMGELKILFPRVRGNGWRIPKFHGMIKIVPFIMDFGCAYNFFGGPGESHHRYFLKQPGANTQRQQKLFVQQSTDRVYKNLALEIACEAEKRKGDQFEQIGNVGGLFEHNHQQSFKYSGRYTLSMQGAFSDATFKEHKVVWHSDRGKKTQKSRKIRALS